MGSKDFGLFNAALKTHYDHKSPKRPTSPAPNRKYTSPLFTLLNDPKHTHAHTQAAFEKGHNNVFAQIHPLLLAIIW